MDCNRWREMASDYIEGTLPPATSEAMRMHAAGCADCRRDNAALAAVCRELNVLPTIDPPLFFRENVMAAIQRQANAAPAPWSPAWWRTLILGERSAAVPSRVARVGVGALLTGGLAAAAAWAVFMPNGSHSQQVAMGSVAPIENWLPGDNTSVARQPILRVSRTTTIAPNVGPAYDLSFWLSNADNGVARWQFVGETRSYTFNLSGAAPQSVRIPYTAAQGKDTIAVYVHWTADSMSHTRYLILPVADDSATTSESTAAPTPVADRQSFGLPDETIVEAARDIAGHYRVPVTLDDIPNADQHVAMTAQSETAEETLRRNLQSSGLEVTESPAGIHLAPAAAPAPSATP